MEPWRHAAGVQPWRYGELQMRCRLFRRCGMEAWSSGVALQATGRLELLRALTTADAGRDIESCTLIPQELQIFSPPEPESLQSFINAEFVCASSRNIRDQAYNSVPYVLRVTHRIVSL